MGHTCSMTDEERFEQFVDRSGDCWVWTGWINHYGYGGFRFRGKSRGAHRVAYELAHGPFDEKLHVLHRCDNPPCVRPDHLWLGTQADNMADMKRKGRAHKQMPPGFAERVHEWKARPYKVITPDGRLIEGVNMSDFCRTYGLNRGAMGAVMRGEIRHHKGYRLAHPEIR